ncbi:MAG: hypothetical protein KKC75_06915 [Nanoarchaeota archaeon]|nr:hypothetical protein [Nanoarchaeota archaeon]MBU1005615.1 hypothetical protein [Nanoarchaeota archaeon]MBU1946001.1 hypothetical protein [Nanoarchaeota archaeon]
MKILIIKLAATGDVLRTTSILPGLKEKYPDSKIFWLTEEYSSELLKSNPLIGSILIANNKEDIQELNKESYNLVINLEDNEESCRIVESLNKETLVGAFLKNNKIVYTKDSSPWFDMGLTSVFGKEKADQLKKENKKTYQDIICNILNIKNSRPILKLTKEGTEFSETFADKHNIKEDSLVIGLNTSAGKRWQLKKLSEKKTIELAENLSKIPNVKLLLFGGPEEKERNKRIKDLLKQKIIDTGCDNSLKEFAALINLCSILITSDSLALNIGIALSKKVIAFFGPTSAAEIDLYGNGIKITPKMDCITCYKKECNLNLNCMEKIAIDDFTNAVSKLMKNG